MKDQRILTMEQIKAEEKECHNGSTTFPTWQEDDRYLETLSAFEEYQKKLKEMELLAYLMEQLDKDVRVIVGVDRLVDCARINLQRNVSRHELISALKKMNIAVRSSVPDPGRNDS